MTDLTEILAIDPTLDVADKQIELLALKEKPRAYLGASSIGNDCNRKLWYSMRPEIPKKAMDALSLKRIDDGHRGEDIIVERLRRVPGLSLWNKAEDGGQIGGTLFNDKFGWHIDGVILGLLQAPKTYHVFEAKIVNETKFNKLKKLKIDYGEKEALAQWDAEYFAQAQVYMYLLDLDRHYLVAGTPGVRDWTSCRTEINKPMAKSLLVKAERIINAKEMPDRLSDDKTFWKCKNCSYFEVCHGS